MVIVLNHSTTIIREGQTTMNFPILPSCLMFLIIAFHLNQPGEAYPLERFVVPVITTMVTAIRESINLFKTVEARQHHVNIPLSPGEDFNADFGHYYYMLVDDWEQLTTKYVSLNEGYHNVGRSLASLKDDMEERFQQVISFKKIINKSFDLYIKYPLSK